MLTDIDNIELVKKWKEIESKSIEEFNNFVNDGEDDEYCMNVIVKTTSTDYRIPDTYCGQKLIFDELQGKYFCPVCGLLGKGRKSKSLKEINESDTALNMEKNNMLVPSDYYTLRQLPPVLLIQYFKLRDVSYNKLWHSWQEAVKGDRKAEFFLSQLNSARIENKKLNDKIRELKKELKNIKRV